MAKGKSTWKYNKLLTARRNYYGLGSFMNSLAGNPQEGKLTSGAFKGMSSNLAGSLGGLGAAVGKVGGGLIGGGMTSGAGDVLSGLSSVASAIPGPWGAVASAGLGLMSGLTNRAFGSKMNEENIAQVENNINELNSFRSNASDFDTLSQNWANASAGMSFDNDFIGKDGWFSSKAKDKAADLRRQVEAGNAWVNNTLVNNAENIAATQMQNLLGNYAAFGGPLLFSKGGSIHIKPENKGKFTETKRRTGKTTEELTHSKNPLTRKRAIFAQNAKKWHHAFGGDLLTHGANFDTGVTLIGNGGTHEENPNEGVQMGMDAEGIPNLVEEGEVIFNDYVFSNRLRVPKEIRKKYKLKGTKPLTFAEAALHMSKESEERPNDPISQAGLEDSMMKLMIEQERLREKKDKSNTFSRGGKMGRVYSGDKNDPYSQALNFGMGPINISSMWTLDKSPVYSAAPTVRNDKGIVLGGYTANPTIINPGESTISDVVTTQKTKDPVETNENTPSLAPTWMRYMPAYASGIMSLTDAIGLTNKPDYTDADMVLDAARSAGSYNPVKFNPIGNYLTYTPFDREFYINQMNAQAGATRRAITNTSGGNRGTAMAGLLAADNNYLNQMGNIARQAEEYNLAQRQKVEEFSRATNMFNTEGALKTGIANQEALLKSRDSYLKGTLSAVELRQRERQQAAAARSANLSNFINSLGDIGRENFARNMIVSDPSKYYTIEANGQVKYKNGFDNLSDAEKRQVMGHAAEHGGTSFSRGGLLTRKRRRK